MPVRERRLFHSEFETLAVEVADKIRALESV
jgi:hypothetical protein